MQPGSLKTLTKVQKERKIGLVTQVRTTVASSFQIQGLKSYHPLLLRKHASWHVCILRGGVVVVAVGIMVACYVVISPPLLPPVKAH
jgi:hypothetical protein